MPQNGRHAPFAMEILLHGVGSGAGLQALPHFIGNATGIMPVCVGQNAKEPNGRGDNLSGKRKRAERILEKSGKQQRLHKHAKMGRDQDKKMNSGQIMKV